jgi:DNA-binding NtrC family response regulator
MKDRPFGRILVVEDDRTIREALCVALEESGYVAVASSGIRSAREHLARSDLHAVLLDIRLEDGDGLEFLCEVRGRWPRVAVIMATAYSDSDRTIRAMTIGAFDYVTKPFDLNTLLAVVARAARAPREAKIEADDAQPVFIGRSPAMSEVWKAIGRAAPRDVPVLITGESGVGKELVARAIHDHSPRRHGAFIAVNMAALSPALIESELFGHEKGAFTGAHARREGRFAVASEGTLFLDEIGDLPLPLQSKLLRVLEDGSFERVGGATPLVSNARIVAATSRMHTKESQGACLRDDLYYRLAVVRIEVAALRERRQDIPMLVSAFLRRQPAPRRGVSEEAMQRLIDYDWPGNVRQLRHVVENACVMSTAEVLDVDALRLPERARVRDGGDWNLPHEGGCLSLRPHLEHVERRLIERALFQAAGNRAHAARLLGIRRALLYARMKHLKLEV